MSNSPCLVEARAWRLLLGALVAPLALTPACDRTSSSSTERASADPPPAVADRPTGPDAALLWRIDGPNGPSFIFGTLHTADEESIHETVWSHLEGATTVVLEVDPGRVDPAEVARRTKLPEGESLRAMLTPEVWSRLVELTGMPEEKLDRLAPWFALSMIYVKQSGTQSGADLLLHKRAKSAGATIDYLETLSQQLDLLETYMTADVLTQTVNDWDKHEEGLAAIEAAYLSGDPDELYQTLFGTGIAGGLAANGPFIRARNERWLPAIERHVAEGGSFFVVGSGHVVGEMGVPALLRARGYTVEQIGAKRGEP